MTIQFRNTLPSHRPYRSRGPRIVRELPIKHHGMVPRHGIYVIAAA